MAAPSSTPLSTCPIPPITAPLEPYILPRSEVTSIRQSLHSHLERQLRLEATQTLSLANVTDPPLTQTLPAEPPASVTGVRKAYWRALRAHQVARERYEGLRAELDVLAGDAGGGGGGDGKGGEVGDLLPLVRARERRRKLGAVERAVEAVEGQGRGVVGAKIDDVVRKGVGEVPVLPSQRGAIGGGGGREEGVMRMVELKKAVLSAKALIAKCSEDGAGVGVKGGGGSELYALQQARNELIGWIEKQLALIGDGQAGQEEDPTSPQKPDLENEHTNPLTNEEIAQLYDHYLETRRSLLETLHQAPQDPSPLAPAPVSPKQTRTSTDNNSETTSSAAAMTLLPFIHPLLATKDEEQNLISQAAYVRRQLSAADSESERLMRRLADESHLVNPGASRGRDWAAAAEGAGEATREFVLGRTKAGEACSREAESALERIEDVPGGLERLVGRA